jgi:hypothetical protein
MITKIEQANCAREYKLSAQFGTLNNNNILFIKKWLSMIVYYQ